MNFFGHEIDFTSKKFWTSIILFIAVCIWCHHFQPQTCEFTCNPQKCEVVNKNISGRTINKQSVDIANIKSFSSKDIYSRGEGGTHDHFRTTIYAPDKRGKTYRFFKKSYSDNNKRTEEIANELNSYLPTTQDKANIYIKF